MFVVCACKTALSLSLSVLLFLQPQLQLISLYNKVGANADGCFAVDDDTYDSLIRSGSIYFLICRRYKRRKIRNYLAGDMFFHGLVCPTVHLEWVINY